MANNYYEAAAKGTSEVGDIIRFKTNSDDGGKYQTFFRNVYDVDLESSGSPTIDDIDAA